MNPLTRQTCALTGKSGRFVRSHILPRALTDKNLDQNARIEFGRGRRPALRHSSWFDDNLVVAEGEKILAKIDQAGMDEIERLGLSWRHFPISPNVVRSGAPDLPFELLRAPDADTKSLRLFFLSLLWRAAFSQRPEFAEIRLDLVSRKKLRGIVNGEVEPHDTDFPIVLILLTSKGEPQNLTPLRQKMKIPNILGSKQQPDLKIFRFFVDGLIAHVGRKSMDISLREKWKGRVLGVDPGLFVIGRRYEGSSQETNLMRLNMELEEDWPDAAQRIFRVLRG